MIEVFKTDVNSRDAASRLANQIRHTFEDYQVNFDLEDCDRILRVKTGKEIIQSARIIALIESHGFHAEILSDN